MSAITIKNPSILHGQTSCILRHVYETQVVKLSDELKQYFNAPLPRGTCIVCTYSGNFGIPFVDIIPYGYAKLVRLENAVGLCYEIEVPQPVKIEDLPLFSGQPESVSIPATTGGDNADKN